MHTEPDVPALDTHDLTRRFRRRVALDACTLSIPQGQVVGLVGPNGAGKSTLLQLACGLLPPSAGRIRVLGSRPAAHADHLAKVAFVAQDAPVYAALSVGEHLTMGRRLNRRWDQQFAERRLDELGLDRRQRAGRLSGGQRAQLALTVAAAKRPELLILDEPAAALDPMARRAFITNLSSFVSELGTTAILSSHLMEDVELACDYLVVLAAGVVRLAGPVDLLRAEHQGAPLAEIALAHMREPSSRSALSALHEGGSR